MDPVSAALSIASTAAATCSVVWKVCEQWRDAPTDVHQLKDTVLQANEFFQGVKYNLETNGTSTVISKTASSSSELEKLLQEGESALNGIRLLLDSLLNGSDLCGNQPDLNRRRRLKWLKNLHKANKLRKRVKEVTAQTCALLISQNMTLSAQLHPALRGAEKSIVDRLATEKSASREHTEAVAEESSSKVLAHLYSQDQQLESMKSLLVGQGRGMTFSQANHELQRRQYLNRGDREADAIDALFYSTSGRLRDLRTSLDCAPGCACTCHTTLNRGRWDSRALAAMLGYVSISYQGIALQNQPCTDTRCHGRQKWLRIDYYLPPWLVRVAVSVFISAGPPAPEVLLRVVRQVDLDTEELSRNIFFLIASNDTEGVKKSLAKRIISAHDERADYGISALSTAIIYENPTIVRLLLTAGADPFQGPDALMPAAKLLTHLHFGTSAILEIADMFPVSSFLDEFEYADLHKIVLGILPLDLETALGNSRSIAAQVNQSTVDGYTPAALAAMRGDVAALATLARAGADLSCRNGRGLLPIHLACQGCHVAAVEFLVDHFAGAQVNEPTTSLGDAPLRIVYKSPHLDSLVLVKLLVEKGADVNAVNNEGEPAIKGAVQDDRAEDVEYLISCGADVDIVDEHGNTALIEAIFGRAYRCVKILLEHGADYTSVSGRGDGVLHFLASFADERTLQIFLDADIGYLNTKLRNKEGLTPMDYLERRSDVQNVRENFKILVDRIERRGSPSLTKEALDGDWLSVNDCSDDEFFDALDI